MGRYKLTISLSKKCLEIIDRYAETTGLESRSRVIEEAVFAISCLLSYRSKSVQQYQQTPNPSPEETMRNFLALVDILSKFDGILDRFERFPIK